MDVDLVAVAVALADRVGPVDRTYHAIYLEERSKFTINAEVASLRIGICTLANIEYAGSEKRSKGANMGVLESCLHYLTSSDYSDQSQLRDVVEELLVEQLDCREIQLWSRVVDDEDLGQYTIVLHYKDGERVPPAATTVLGEEALRKKLDTVQMISTRIPLTKAAGFMPSPIHYFAIRRNPAFTSEELTIVELVLTKVSRDCFRASIRKVYENIDSLLPLSKDLTSFLHRSIHSVLIPEFKFEAVSIYYYEKKTASLILGATTGIDRQETLGLKRSDVRYFTDSPSYTSRSFREAAAIVENRYKSGPLRRNTLGERVGQLHSRVYIPLRRWDGDGERTFPTPLGIIRAVNPNSDNGFHPLTLLEMARLRVASRAMAAQTEKYVRTLTVLHDQERATHGYNTDLCAIKYAAENIGKWIQQVDKRQLSSGLEDVLQEIGYRTRDIIAVQDNMASQLLTVMHYSGSSRMIHKPHETTKCDQPFKQIFMRLATAKKGMSDCFGRSELRLTFSGKSKVEDDFIRIPALSVPVGELYLVVRNIAENAIKYSQKGLPPRLDIAWRIEGRMAEFQFRDYGIGISESDRPFIGREGFRG